MFRILFFLWLILGFSSCSKYVYEKPIESMIVLSAYQVNDSWHLLVQTEDDYDCDNREFDYILDITDNKVKLKIKSILEVEECSGNEGPVMLDINLGQLTGMENVTLKLKKGFKKTMGSLNLNDGNIILEFNHNFTSN